MNPITGEKIIKINGHDYVMRFNWRALAEIEAKYGDTPNFFNPEVLAFLAAAGLRERHPEMTAEKITELSPPLVLFSVAVQEALKWAYVGNETIPAKDKDDVKKNSPKGRLSRLMRWLWVVVFRR